MQILDWLFSERGHKIEMSSGFFLSLFLSLIDTPGGGGGTIRSWRGPRGLKPYL